MPKMPSPAVNFVLTKIRNQRNVSPRSRKVLSAYSEIFDSKISSNRPATAAVTKTNKSHLRGKSATNRALKARMTLDPTNNVIDIYTQGNNFGKNTMNDAR